VLDLYSALLSSGVLLFAFASILWGLRVFKVFLVILGAWSGYALGGFIGDFAFEVTDKLYLWSLAGAIIGGLVAWPLQRLLVYGAVGTSFGFLAFVMVMSNSDNAQTALLAAGAVFVVSGFLAVMIYDYFVIILMGTISAYALIDICYLPGELRSLTHSLLAGSQRPLEKLIAFSGNFAQLLWPSVLVMALIVLLAVYMQKILPRQKGDQSGAGQSGKSIARKITFSLALVLIAFAFLDSLLGISQKYFSQSGREELFLLRNLLSPSGAISGFCHLPLINISPISFPIAAFVSSGWLYFYSRRVAGRIGRGNRWLNGLIAGLALGLLVLPALETLILLAVTGFAGGQLAAQYWLSFYRSFLDTTGLLLIFKWAYCLLFFPALTALALPAQKPKAVSAPIDLPSNYCI